MDATNSKNYFEKNYYFNIFSKNNMKSYKYDLTAAPCF
jgi:hypothetical protein